MAVLSKPIPQTQPSSTYHLHKAMHHLTHAQRFKAVDALFNYLIHLSRSHSVAQWNWNASSAIHERYDGYDGCGDYAKQDAIRDESAILEARGFWVERITEEEWERYGWGVCLGLAVKELEGAILGLRVEGRTGEAHGLRKLGEGLRGRGVFERERGGG